ncbi:hypothetical protein [Pseudobacteroides cellulosolvens]|uniref:hypothetical protein n=1 Tax=Pseudobacteroides cellulosolvens TaxID=35825 RepID=UPI00055A54CB|nr:hypothetical protein [Pseudobacteroides cellulosolvens]
MRGFYRGLPGIMAAPFTSSGWYFTYYIFSKSVDIALLWLPTLVQRLVFTTGFFSKIRGFIL